MFPTFPFFIEADEFFFTPSSPLLLLPSIPALTQLPGEDEAQEADVEGGDQLLPATGALAN